MADTTIEIDGLPTGWTVYTQIQNAAGQFWNGTAYVAYSVGDWASYATATPETGSTGTYVCQFPLTSPAGFYAWTMFRQYAGSPSADNDAEVSVTSDDTYWNGDEFSTAAPANPSPVDLITSAYAEQVLAAGGITLTGSQSAILATLITAASREIIRYCSRQFALTTYSEIVTPEGTRQDRGEPSSAKLSAFPVQSITSVLTNRSTVLTIRNTDTTTNQFASVVFTMTGDVEYLDLVYTGLTLSRMASGVTTTDTLTFAANVTLGALATAINALGNGWNATVQSSYELYPSASLVGVREPKNALSNGACLDLFVTPAESYDIDRATGIMRCYGGQGGSGYGGFYGGFSDVFGDSLDGQGGYGGAWGWGQYQATYTAGWSTIPENLQQVCAEIVKGMYARLDTDPSLKSETADKYSYTLRDVISSLPDWAKDVLLYYKSWSV